MSAPRVLDQTYASSSAAEEGVPFPKSAPTSARSASSSQPPSPTQGPVRSFGQLSEREQVRHLWGSRRRRKMRKGSKKTHKKRRSTRRK